MKLNKMIFALSLISLAACVTEPKPGEETKNFASYQSNEVVESKPALSTKKDALPGHIVVKCRIQAAEVGKTLLCGPTTVKLISEGTKLATEYTFKGDRGAIPVPSGSYTIEATTKGCPETRKFLGMTSGMGLTAQFDNCAVK